MKNILNNINTLDGFMNSEEAISCANMASEMNMMGSAVHCYNAVDFPEFDDKIYDGDMN